MSVKIMKNSVSLKDETTQTFLPIGMFAAGGDKSLKEFKEFADTTVNEANSQVQRAHDNVGQLTESITSALKTGTDTTLTLPGVAADAKVAGDKIGELSESITKISERIGNDEPLVSYDYPHGNPSAQYGNNNIGWTGANGLKADYDGIVKKITLVSHPSSLTTYSGKIQICKLTMDGNKIISIDDTYELTSTDNKKEQTFNVNITLKKGQILLFKGIGYGTIEPKSPVFFETGELTVGSTIGTYTMSAPIQYEILPLPIQKQIDNISHKSSGKKYVSFGDSITDDQISGIGSVVCEMLNADKIANWARGNATMSDYSTESGDTRTNTTVISLKPQEDAEVNTNVLSNQVRRMLQWVTPLGEQIKWTHPISGVFSLDTSVGVGLGHTEDNPDIIYIALGTNDTKQNYRWIDDCETVFAQSYSQLQRITVCSSLRWAIETLQCKFPNAQIFVASPLQTKRGWTWGTSTYTGLRTQDTWHVREIIEKTCRFCSVHFIDSYAESGFSNFIAQSVNDGIHPTGIWKYYIARYIANEIENRYTERD